MKVEESLNVTFDETPPPPKTSPLEDDELVEEEAIEIAKRSCHLHKTKRICISARKAVNKAPMDELVLIEYGVRLDDIQYV
ncbi:hypothetical protein Tco_0633576 [Tanacetum coccineum]